MGCCTSVCAQFLGEIWEEPDTCTSPEIGRADEDHRFDLNSCTASELESLPGIGETKAQWIIEARPFDSLESLADIKGIGLSTVAKLREHVRVVSSEESQDSGGGLPKTPPHTASEETKIASWNIRCFSDRKTDDELRKIASVMTRFSVVAVQEVRTIEVCQRLLVFLDAQGGSSWECKVSDPVGRGARNADDVRVYEERYAFFYDTGQVELTSEPVLAKDPEDLLVREPLLGFFRCRSEKNGSGRSRGFDFILACVHLIFGDEKEDRTEEMRHLHGMLDALQRACGSSERDIILVGDFNLAPKDCPWIGAGDWVPIVPATAPTTIFGSSYDNIWIPSNGTLSNGEWTGKSGVEMVDHEFFPATANEEYSSESALTARRECSSVLSDHRPVWATFKSRIDDDGGTISGVDNAIQDAVLET